MLSFMCCRCRVAGGLVGALDGGEPPVQRRGGDTGLRLVGQEQGDGFRGRRQYGQGVNGAPVAEDSDIAGVGFAGGEAQTLVDVVLGGFGQIEERWRGVFGGNNGGHVRWFLVPGMSVIGSKSYHETAGWRLPIFTAQSSCLLKHLLALVNQYG